MNISKSSLVPLLVMTLARVACALENVHDTPEVREIRERQGREAAILLNMFMSLELRFATVAGDAPEAIEAAKNAGRASPMRYPASFQEMARLMSKDFYTEKLVASGIYKAAQEQLSTEERNFLGATERGEPYFGYLFLLPPPGAMAISGHRAGTLPVDLFSECELIMTPAEYDDQRRLSFFLSCQRKMVFAKDMGRAVDAWSFFERERPFMPESGWSVFTVDFSPPAPAPSGNTLPLLENGRMNSVELNANEGAALITLVNAVSMQYEISRGRRPERDRSLGVLDEVISVLKGAGRSLLHDEFSPGARVTDGYCFYMHTGHGGAMPEEKETDGKSSFEVIATPKDYPGDGRYTFYFNSREDAYRVRDLGHKVGSWRDFKELIDNDPVSRWGSVTLDPSGN